MNSSIVSQTIVAKDRFAIKRSLKFRKNDAAFLNFFLLLIIPSLLFAGPAIQKKSVQKKSYISQDYVDTSIQRAFYVLNEAASIAGVGFKQQQSIDVAKSIARNLRQQAKSDPNGKYILWKVSELEAQIYLEEKDILLMRMQQGQISINEIVARYNAEVGKSRPDFASMRRMHVQMGTLDNVKSNQLADSYNKRYRSISREVQASVENSINNGDLEKAREELGYCLRNAAYLSITSSAYSNLENRVEKLAKALQEMPQVQEETQIALAALNKNDLSTARDNLSSAENRLNSIEKYLPRNETSALQANLNKGKRTLPFKEDSLVTLNLSILSIKGVKEADQFLNKVLRSQGVSIEKTALVDKAILSVGAPEDTRIRDEISSVNNTPESDGTQPSILDDMLARAKRIALDKADSLHQIEEEVQRVAMLEQQRLDSIAAVHRAAEQIVYQQKQEQAQKISLDIYSYLEKNKTPTALSQFSKQRPFLLEFLDKESFYILETTLIQFTTPIPPPEPIKVASNNPQITHAVAQQQTSETVPIAIQEKYKKNQLRAEKEIAEIYNLLEKNRISDAYTRFQEIRKPLQMFLQSDIYSMLETTLLQAWEFQRSMESGK